MAIEFPPNPTIGDMVTGSYGEVYTFDGVKWTLTTGGSEGGAFLPLTGGTLSGPLIAPTVTIGVASATAPAPLTVGGRGISYSTLAAVGEGIGFAVVSGQLYCYQNGVALAGPFAVTGQLGNYLPIVGGNLTGNLTTTGGLITGIGQDASSGNSIPVAYPPNATPGNAIFWQGCAYGSYLLNAYWDANLQGSRQLAGTGTSAATVPQSAVNLTTNGTQFQISIAPPTDDNAQIAGAVVAAFDGSDYATWFAGTVNAPSFLMSGFTSFGIYTQVGLGSVFGWGPDYYNSCDLGIGWRGWWGDQGNLMALDYAGNLWAQNWTSDSRVKRDLTPANDGLDIVLQLEPKRYRRTLFKPEGHDEPPEELGLIAQDVQEVLPVAVTDTTLSRGDDKNLLGLKQEALIAVLINAVKELAERIEELERGAATE